MSVERGVSVRNRLLRSRNVIRRRWRRGLSDNQLAVAMVFPALALMLGYLLYPLVIVASSSLMSFDTLTGPGRWVGLQNYQAVFASDLFVPSLQRSIYYTAANIVVQTILAFGIALLLNGAFPGRGLVRGSILFPFIVPAVVVALIFSYLFNDLVGLVNYVLIEARILKAPLGWLDSPSMAMNTVVAVSVWRFLPFMTVLFLARLQTLNTELLEAARADGATALQALRHVILPWMLPTIIVVVLLRTIGSFNEFETPYLLTQGGPDDRTLVLPVLIRILLLDNQDPGQASAVAILMLGIVAMAAAIYFVFYRRSERTLAET